MMQRYLSKLKFRVKKASFSPPNINNIGLRIFRAAGSKIMEATQFIRKYICDKDTEIVIIEDNCPIHSTEEIENEIEKLKIAFLPIVPYNTCLYEVIEGYFGLIKSNNYLTTGYSSIISIKSAIEFNWKILTHQLFDDKVCVQLLSDWFNRIYPTHMGYRIFLHHFF